MASPVKENYYINLSEKKRVPKNRWNGYNVRFINNEKDVERAIIEILNKNKS